MGGAQILCTFTSTRPLLITSDPTTVTGLNNSGLVCDLCFLPGHLSECVSTCDTLLWYFYQAECGKMSRQGRRMAQKTNVSCQLCPDNVDGQGAALSNHLSVHTLRTAAFCLLRWPVKAMSSWASPFFLFFLFCCSRQRYWLWAPSCVCLCLRHYVSSQPSMRRWQKRPLKAAEEKNHSVIHSLTHWIPCALMATLGKPGPGAVFWHPGRCHLSSKGCVCVGDVCTRPCLL